MYREAITFFLVFYFLRLGIKNRNVLKSNARIYRVVLLSTHTGASTMFMLSLSSSDDADIWVRNNKVQKYLFLKNSGWGMFLNEFVETPLHTDLCFLLT